MLEKVNNITWLRKLIDTPEFVNIKKKHNKKLINKHFLVGK